jgi:hypothetical protein
MDYEFQNQTFRQTQSAGSSPVSSSVQRPQDAMFIDLSTSSPSDPVFCSQEHNYPISQPKPLPETPHSEKRRRILTTERSANPHPIRPYDAQQQLWQQMLMASGTPVQGPDPNGVLNNYPSFEHLSIHSPHIATNLVRSLSSSSVPSRNPYTPLPTDQNMPVSSMEYTKRMMVRQQNQAMYSQMQRQHPMSMMSSPANIQTPTMASSSSLSIVDDDDLIVDEEMTNRNICLGMIRTDIVAIKTIELVKDEGFEAIQVLNEGRRDKSENYSFVVSSRTPPKRFFGWLPFEDTKFLGPLADAGMIWWDAVIPRNKSNQHRTPVFIILYCQPTNMKQVGANLRYHGVHLEEPPFFNPSCRYQNPNPPVVNAPSNRAKSSYGGYESGGTGLADQTKQDISELLDSIPSSFGRKPPSSRTALTYMDENGTINILEGSDMGDVEDIADDGDEIDESQRHINGLKIALMKHQVHGVNWMIDREANKSSNGGILADVSAR